MRIRILAAPVVLGLALAACASDPTVTDRYSSDFDRLTEQCRARGGILSPTGGTTGRPQTEYVCEVRGQTGRAPSG